MHQEFTHHGLLGDIENQLTQTGTTEAGLKAVLEQVLDSLDCAAGTIHSLDSHLQMLHLYTRRNIPDGLLPRIQQIPVGKGMAGLAAERCCPVQACNLQTDTSGVAKPGAKETGMEGSIAVPILVGDRVVGVLGVAKPSAYEFKETEIALLLDVGGVIGRFMVCSE